LSEMGRLSVEAAEVRSHLAARRRAFEGFGKGTKFVAREGAGVATRSPSPTKVRPGGVGSGLAGLQAAWDTLPAPALASVLAHVLAQCRPPRSLNQDTIVPSAAERAAHGVLRQVSWPAPACLGRVLCFAFAEWPTSSSRVGFLDEFPRDGWRPMGFAYSRQTALCHPAVGRKEGSERGARATGWRWRAARRRCARRGAHCTTRSFTR
jgi:hypothetical protein